MNTQLLRFVCYTFALSLIALTAGCSQYIIYGKVIQGEICGAEIVHELDPRMKMNGVPDTQVFLFRDPDTLNRHQAAHDRSNARGQFAFHVGEFGAGWMQEEWLVRSMKQGFQNAESIVKLPSKSQQYRVLITVCPGVATSPDSSRDYIDDYDKYR